MSRHKHQPTEHQRSQVLMLTGLGITQDQIATLLRLAPKTLRLRYRHELDTGAIEANAAVAQSLFNMAVRDRVPSAAIFWLKARAGWKEARPDDNQAAIPTAYEFYWADAKTNLLPGEANSLSTPTIDAEAEAEPIDVVWQGEK